MFKEGFRKAIKSVKNFFIVDDPKKLLRLNAVTIFVVALSLVALGFAKEEKLSHAEPDVGDKWVLEWTNQIPYNLPGETFKRYRYKMKSSSGKDDTWAFCIDHSVSELCQGKERTSYAIDNPNAPFWKSLSVTAKRGISIASTYGFRNENSIPEELEGKLTTDDMWWATQCVIWEYSSGIRINSTDNFTTKESPMYASLKGTKAEIGYDYILNKIRDHLKTPSFANRDASKLTASDEIVLKKQDDGTWAATVKDTNKVATSLSFVNQSDASPIEMKKVIDPETDKYEYKFISKEELKSTKTLKFEKYVSGNHVDSLVWARGDTKACQTMYSGSMPYDLFFYAKVRTEKPGLFVGEKEADDKDKLDDGIQDIYKDIKFMVTGNGINSGDMILTLDSNGKLVNSKNESKIELTPGIYTLTEIDLPDRYRKPIVKNFTVGEEGNVSITGLVNDIKEGFIEFQKYYREEAEEGSDQKGELKPEAGATFRIYAKDYADKGFSYDRIPDKWKAETTTDSLGKFKTKALPYGPYYIEQITGDIKNFKCSKMEMAITEDNKTYEFSCIDENIESKLKIIKKDEETNKVIPYANTSFKIKNVATNKYVTMNKIDTFKTNEDGVVLLPGYLSYGTYKIVEVNAPSGYYRNPEGVVFTVDAKAIEDVNGGEVNVNTNPIVIEFKNKAQKVNLDILKMGEMVKEEGKNSSVIEAPLAYAEFELIATEDIFTKDGTLRVKAGTSVGKHKTNEFGKLSFENLYLGKYELFERGVYSKEILYEFTSDELEAAKVKYTELYQKKYINNNYNTKGIVSNVVDTAGSSRVTGSEGSSSASDELEKQLEKLRTIMEGKVYEVSNGALYKELDKEPIADDLFIEAIKFVIDTKMGNSKERFVLNNDYKVLESAIEKFDFKYGDQDKDVITVERSYKNDLEKGKLELSKTDVSDGKVIPGASIRVYNEAKKIVCEEKSSKSGKLTCDKLPVGIYYFQEYDAPKGYILDEALYKFEVKKDGEIVKAKMTNKKNIVSVPKTSKNKSNIIYIISAFMILIGSSVSIGYIKKDELKSLFVKFKEKFSK